MEYFTDRLGNRHVLYPCSMQDCNRKRPGYNKFCSECNKKYTWSKEKHDWVLKAKYAK